MLEFDRRPVSRLEFAQMMAAIMAVAGLYLLLSLVVCATGSILFSENLFERNSLNPKVALPASVVLLVVGAGLVFLIGSSATLREERLRKTLIILREALARYQEANGKGPPTLDELVEENYLTRIPKDPITGSSRKWLLEHSESGGVRDVHCGTDAPSLDGTSYNTW